MSGSLRRIIRCAAILLALSGAFGLGGEALACPNCKLANEADDNKPKAYMYSILFMIGMPATIFTGFGVSFYRMAKKAQAENDAAADSDADQIV